jgi:hypothetical protein
MLRKITSGLRSLFRKERVDQELNEEFAYLEMAAEEKIKQGTSRKDALRAVRLEQGSVEVTKEVIRSAAWEAFVETCWQDLRCGARWLAKNPGFAAVAVLTLALGVGTNTIIFSIIHAVLLTPLPYRDSAGLVVIYDRDTRATGLSKLMDLYHDFKEYREHSRKNRLNLRASVTFSGLRWPAAC